MHLTRNKALRVTAQHGSRMTWLAAIMAPICLCLVLSSCGAVTSAATNSTAANNTHKTATNTSKSRTTKAQTGAAPTATAPASAPTATTPTQATPAVQTRVFNGTVTAWTSSGLFPGPATQTVPITNQIDTATGATTSSFAPFTLTDPSTGNTITVSIPAGSTASGQFDAATGALAVTTPLLFQNVPVVGTVTTKPTNLGTGNTITIPNGTQFSGAPLDANNNITVVGNTSFNAAFMTVNVQMQITGVLGAAQ